MGSGSTGARTDEMRLSTSRARTRGADVGLRGRFSCVEDVGAEGNDPKVSWGGGAAEDMVDLVAGTDVVGRLRITSIARFRGGIPVD